MRSALLFIALLAGLLASLLLARAMRDDTAFVFRDPKTGLCYLSYGGGRYQTPTSCTEATDER